MKKPSAVVVLLVIGSVFLPPPTPACPIVPTSWGLVGEAELIVLARVESVEVAIPTDDFDDSGYLYLRDVAILRVLETWKGESRTEVRVQFRSGPFAVLREGEVVLAFLESGETRARERAQRPGTGISTTRSGWRKSKTPRSCARSRRAPSEGARRSARSRNGRRDCGSISDRSGTTSIGPWSR